MTIVYIQVSLIFRFCQNAFICLLLSQEVFDFIYPIVPVLRRIDVFVCSNWIVYAMLSLDCPEFIQIKTDHPHEEG